MKRKISLIFCLLAVGVLCHAQWEVGAGAGMAIPITGYGEVVKTGWLLNAEGKYRFKKGNFAVGMKAHMARLQKDKNGNDTFQNARMTVAPFIFTAEFSATKGKLQPYITGGLGISFYNINYEVSPTEGKTIFNVSFTMMPLVGLRYAASKHIYPFVEWEWMLLADGPPIGFPKSSQLTGYQAICAGITYRFN